MVHARIHIADNQINQYEHILGCDFITKRAIRTGNNHVSVRISRGASMKNFKIISIAIVMLLGMMVVPNPLGISNNVSGSSDSHNSDSQNSGYLTSLDLSGNATKTIEGWNLLAPQWGGTGTGNLIAGHGKSFPSVYKIYRGFLSFDTSSIPSSDTVISCELNMKTYNVVYPHGFFNISVYNTWYPTPFTNSSAIWNATTSLEGTIVNSSATQHMWYNLDMEPSNVNKSGLSQYQLRISKEGTIPGGFVPEWVKFYTANDTGNEPYLIITTVSGKGATITYNYTALGMTNTTTTIYPQNTIDYNFTHELIGYEFYNFNQSWIHFELPGHTYNSIHPYANVTYLGNDTWNITGCNWQNIHFYIWFFKEKDFIATTLHIATYHETIGLGFFHNEFPVYININTGSGYDNGSATRVWNPDYEVRYGLAYTLSVMDYFRNYITSYNFTANQEEMDIAIPIPIQTLQIINYRQDTSLMAIYFNATGNPFTRSVVGNDIYAMPIRNGTYMITISYLHWINNNQTESLLATYYYNITINGDYNFYIGESEIRITRITVTGIETDVETITTWVTPDVIWYGSILPVVPVERGGTRSPLASGDYILKHPYSVIEVTVKNNFTGTSYTFDDPQPSTGTTEILLDELTISGLYNTHIMLNQTDGTNVLNLSVNPGKIDIMNYNLVNFTVWSNLTISVSRETETRQTSIFFWEFYPTTKYYQTTLTMNNTTPFDYYRVYWFVGFAEDSIPNLADADRQPGIRDLNNSIDLTKGEHFEIGYSGYHLAFDRINSTISRAFRFHYYEVNATRDELQKITINDFRQASYGGDEYWKGSGTWHNPFPINFEGRIDIELTNLAGSIDSDSLIVEMDGRILTRMTEYSLKGNVIEIYENAIDIVEIGDVLSFNTYFNYQDYDQPVSGVLFWGLIISIIVVGISAMGSILREEPNSRRRLVVFWGIIATIWLFIVIFLASCGLI